MFQKSFMEMTVADYDSCPHESNGAESHNRISDSRNSNFEATLEHYYRVDKDVAFDQLAASMGVSTG